MRESHEGEFYFEFPVWIVVNGDAMRTHGLPYAMIVSRDENNKPVLPVFTDKDLAQRHANIIRSVTGQPHEMSTPDDLALLLRSYRDGGGISVAVDLNVTADKAERRIDADDFIRRLQGWGQ
jgi:hypothetical protein